MHKKKEQNGRCEVCVCVCVCVRVHYDRVQQPDVLLLPAPGTESLGAHAQRGLQYLVCACLSTPILALQATRRPMSYTNDFVVKTGRIVFDFLHHDFFPFFISKCKACVSLERGLLFCPSASTQNRVKYASGTYANSVIVQVKRSVCGCRHVFYHQKHCAEGLALQCKSVLCGQVQSLHRLEC